MVARKCWEERTVRIQKQDILGGTIRCGSDLNVPTGYVQKWIEVYKQRDAGNRPAMMVALREATRGFAGVTDVPAVDFVGELIELYPNVKVGRVFYYACPMVLHPALSSFEILNHAWSRLLTVAKQVMGVRRDPDAWWKSMGNLNKVASPWWLPYFLAPMPTWRWFPAFIEGIRGRGKLGAKVSGNVVPGPRMSNPVPPRLTNPNR